jgi:hypothetical protein
VAELIQELGTFLMLIGNPAATRTQIITVDDTTAPVIAAAHWSSIQCVALVTS